MPFLASLMSIGRSLVGKATVAFLAALAAFLWLSRAMSRSRREGQKDVLVKHLEQRELNRKVRDAIENDPDNRLPDAVDKRLHRWYRD